MNTKIKDFFLNNYFYKVYNGLVSLNEKNFFKSIKLISKLKTNNKIIFIGNGGSASISSHCATDFSKILKIRCMTFNDSNLITCFANDYGHDNWMKEALKIHAQKNDIIFLISSSGKSKNILNCASQAKRMSCKIVTFSGFKQNNELKKRGDINFWINSKVYNHVEMIHHLWILSLCDYISKTRI
jgi:D-sedoheptulose 7-phosphate isomerase